MLNGFSAIGNINKVFLINFYCVSIVRLSYKANFKTNRSIYGDKIDKNR